MILQTRFNTETGFLMPYVLYTFIQHCIKLLLLLNIYY